MKKYTMMASLLIAGVALKAQSAGGLEMGTLVPAAAVPAAPKPAKELKAPVSKSENVSFIIKGKIEEFEKPAKIVLEHFDSDEDRFIADTLNLKNGTFTFKGSVKKPMKSFMSVIGANDDPRIRMAMGSDGEPAGGRDARTVYLDNGIIEIKGKTLKTAVITGSKSQNDYEALKAALKPASDKINELENQYTTLDPNDAKAMEEMDKKFNKVYAEEVRPANLAFIKSHPDSYVSLNLFLQGAVTGDFNQMKSTFDLLSDKLKNTQDGKDFLKRGATAVGQHAPNFTMADAEGNPVQLSSFRGKYVLLDFWASWCGPCRAENPHVKKAYDQFKDKNFEVLAVSLDSKKDDWLKAIKEDGMPWTHVSDLKGWKNEAALIYGIQAVPQSWLIGPDGVIISRNLRGDDLAKKLAELLK